MAQIVTIATILLLVSRCCVQAKGVFAHFMVGNTGNDFGISDWDTQFDKASEAGIQAFALNIAADWAGNDDAIHLAFLEASKPRFNIIKLFFSFDYAGGGAWDKEKVVSMINQYKSHGRYWQHDGPNGLQPLVSTFEGPDNAGDWKDIKARTGCFFMPDWSSLGAGPAAKLADGVADGLFSWAAWPWLGRKMDTYTDHSYMDALKIDDTHHKPYMMAVSPWFYTNMPGYNKNWLWKGGNLWYERWQQVWQLQPEYVEIISWNDFGESHYIGPLNEKEYTAFDTGEAPFNYVRGLEHAGWLEHLPFMIQTYLYGNSQFTRESVVVSHHATSAKVCTNGGGTTGNTASQLQLESNPEYISTDTLYIAALLTEPTEMYIQSTDGNHPVEVVQKDKWDIMPDGGVGLYYVRVPVQDPGNQHIGFSRNGIEIGGVNTDVSTECMSGGKMNWNARVSSDNWPLSKSGGPWEQKQDVEDRVCIQGWGEGLGFNDLCEFTCGLGYCPDSCVCENIGEQRDKPDPTYDKGFPANGDDNYAGLCDFACNLGHCPSEWCSPTKKPQYIPDTSPFLPDTCTKGTGTGDYVGLCDYACHFGFCPMHMCTCLVTGPLNLPPPVTDDMDWRVFRELNDSNLCWFACIRGYCPDNCKKALPSDEGGRWDFSWANRYAAIGDSYAAGIGIGALRTESDAYDCSRYDGAYPLKVQQIVQAKNFLFTACSGDTTVDMISKQIYKLGAIPRTPGDYYDLITVSAGGNDVGFSDVLKACVFLPTSPAKCTDALATAESNIDNRLETQVVSLLSALQPRLAIWTGVIAWTLYAKFFDEAPEPCNDQTWCFTPDPVSTLCAKVTVELRQEMNRLVGKTNDVLLSTFAQWNTQYPSTKVHAVEWSGFVMATDGQFCESDSADAVDDPSNDKLAFIRPNLNVYVPPTKGRLARHVLYDSGDASLNSTTEIEALLALRDTPGWLPDSISRNFHPNQLGASIQAELTVGVIAQAREDFLDPGIDISTCPLP
ncbi:glycosyl hydrolase family 71-domain-containing protein [Lophiotrema nucula]|uniref:Glycosyl hydrolase family 71-domain-containing protein n=1 Tax=Lophiotrema nucula TaxID=690887 RepID=A0A6A5ZF06_9PLEO|nr:glycosyl hydrolase family 71-domain-containing protein [Lophiotrema nucula]